MGRRPLRLLRGDGNEACGGKSVPGEEQRIGDAGENPSKGVVSVVSDWCKMYYP